MKRMHRRAAIGMVSILAGSSPAFAGVVHVDAGAPGGGDGASWETAFDDLHDGLAAAVAGDEIWVTAGVYRPAGPGGSRSATFTLRTDVAVYGGFAGDETARDDRDWTANPSTLSGDLDGDDGRNRENNDENSAHVITASTAAGAVIDGFTVSGGNAWLNHGGGVYASGGGPLTIANCVFVNNAARTDGGGVFYEEGPLIVVRGCDFRENEAAVGGGLHAYRVDMVEVTDSRFVEHIVEAGASGVFVSEFGDATFSRCEFRENHCGLIGSGGGAVIGFGGHAAFTDCLFADNFGGFNGGGLGLASAATLVNCAFSRNRAERGGAIIVGAYPDQIRLINCSLGNNQGGAIETSLGEPVSIVNSVVWGNTPEPFLGTRSLVVTYSDVEGGWPGEGNIDADPLFVGPGMDDLRLGVGSPCVDAGDNDAVPPGVEVDLAGNPRIENGTVDMGAYEGEFDVLPYQDEDQNVDDGEGVVLIPNGGGFAPEENTLAIFNNRSGEDDQWARLTEYRDDRHPGAKGFGTLGVTAQLATSIDDGGFFTQIFIPFTEEQLDGLDPFELDLTYFDAGTGNWALATSRNTAASPGHRGSIGDRHVREGPGPWGVTLDLGDYGVFFNTSRRRGFVWANVDHAADYSSGVPLCPADAEQPPDSVVDFDDVLVVLDHWGAGAGPYDVNDDGVVDVEDLIEVLSNWGGCE